MVSNFPTDGSFYDFYFDIDACAWTRFSLEQELKAAKRTFNLMIPSQKRIENLFVPSSDTIRHAYLLECLVTRQQSTLIIGPASSGRSALVRYLLFDGVYEFSRKMSTEHITLSSHSNCVTMRTSLEGLLQYGKDEDGVLAYRPPRGNKLVCYIQDMHLSDADEYGDMSAIECIRDYLETGGWLCARKTRRR